MRYTSSDDLFMGFLILVTVFFALFVILTLTYGNEYSRDRAGSDAVEFCDHNGGIQSFWYGKDSKEAEVTCRNGEFTVLTGGTDGD